MIALKSLLWSVIAGVIVSLVVTMCFGASSASANYADSQGRPRFSSYTENRDPVNILFTGGTDGPPGCYIVLDRAVYSKDCVEQLLDVIVDHWNDSPLPYCPGSDELDFIGQDSRKQDINISSSRVCAKQFHLRVWDDREIDNPTGQFMVGAVHHEQLIVRPKPSVPYIEADHEVDGWETAEAVLTRNAFLQGRCSYYGFRTMPHQRPSNSYRGFPNDGRLSRISQTHGGSCGSG